MGAPGPARQRHHHRALRTQDLAAGRRGEEVMRKVGIVFFLYFIHRERDVFARHLG